MSIVDAFFLFYSSRRGMFPVADRIYGDSFRSHSHIFLAVGTRSYAIMAENVPAQVQTKVKSCGGNVCPTCGKCCDWHRSTIRWHKLEDVTCSGTTVTDIDGDSDGEGSTRTYVTGHGPAMGWEPQDYQDP